MRNSTLLFLIKKDKGVITDICLAMKRRGFGTGRYNGVGGKVEEGETIKDAAIRETKEEVGVDVQDLSPCAEITFIYSHKPEWDQVTHIFFCENWSGEPTEGEEVSPKWFSVADIPYINMWPDDSFWLPKVLAGDYVRGRFVFAEGDVILEQEINVQ
jgi:8-oxo-dGTP pyrophosphatase MutT (NUDIX family)